MLKKITKYVAGKISGVAAGRAAKWGFWSAVWFIGPTAFLSPVGIAGLATAAVVTHSGVLDYTASKAVNKLIE